MNIQVGSKIRIVKPRSYNETLYLVGQEAIIDFIVEWMYVQATFINGTKITHTGSWVIAWDEFESV